MSWLARQGRVAPCGQDERPHAPMQDLRLLPEGLHLGVLSRMCLGELGQVRAVMADGALIVESATRTSTVSAMVLEQSVSVGDWVMTHAGFALAVLTDDEAHEAMAIRGEGHR
jgi:hydrogenase expression/formation protein HypC